MEGRLLSTLRWGGNSSVRRVAAKAWLVAWLRMADHLETKAVWRAGCRMARACRALDLAKSRLKLAASWLHLHPTSMASTKSLHRLVARSSGYVRSLLFFAPSCCVQGCPPVGAFTVLVSLHWWGCLVLTSMSLLGCIMHSAASPPGPSQEACKTRGIHHLH